MDQKPRRRRHPKPTHDQKIGRVIRKAAQVIEDRGWVRGEYGGKETGFCVLGAVNFVAQQNIVMNMSAIGKFNSWLKECGEPCSLPAWNDTKDQTKENVLLYMRKLADEIDPQIY